MTTLEDVAPQVSRQEGRRARIRDFFYALEVPYGLAIVRIILPIALLFAMVPRWPYARELFSTDGAPIKLWAAYDCPDMFPTPSGEMAVVANSVVVLTLLTSCFGWYTRTSLILTTFLYTYLNIMDIIGTMNKYSVIASHLLFILCLSNCGSVWSLDNWLRRSRLRRAGLPSDVINLPERSPAWPRRLMQFFAGAVYIGAGITKFRIPAYFTGLQIQTWMITEYNVPNPFGSWFAFQPSLVCTFAYIAILWECTFIFLAWRGIPRLVMIAMGTVFHIMTLFTLGLWVFPVVCISSYFSFLHEGDVKKVQSLLTRWRARNSGLRAAIAKLFRLRDGWTAPVVQPRWCHAIFGALLVVTAVGGLGAEYQLDPYGMRRTEGPYPLKELDPDYVSQILIPTERIRNEDKVLLFNVGSKLFAGAVMDRRTEFRQGEMIRAECDLVPPHEDMWLECNLHDSENRVVDTVGVYSASDSMRAHFYYNLGDCTSPGEYWLVLKIAGEEILRRPIIVLPRKTGACAANAN